MSVVSIKDACSMQDLLNSASSFSLPQVGDTVEGIVVSVSKTTIIINIQNAAMGIIQGDEAQDSGQTLKNIKVGDAITATVLALENESGYLVLSIRHASQEKTWDRFASAYESGDKLEVSVKQANKGGLLVEEDGIRGFIPVSQLSPEYYPRVQGGNAARILEKLERLVEKRLKVKVINIDESDGRLILSEKEAKREERDKVMNTLEVNKIIRGTVSGIVDFGIFVNYQGVEGLVHISEIDWGHVANPSQYGRVGDEVDVVVIGVDGEKISFSMKRLTPDPWIAASKQFKIGKKVTGAINKITDYGVFIKIDESISGLVHSSEIDTDEEEVDPRRMFSIGQEVEATIINIDDDAHEIGLSMKKDASSQTKKDDKEVKDDEEEKTQDTKEESQEVEEQKEADKEVKKEEAKKTTKKAPAKKATKKKE